MTAVARKDYVGTLSALQILLVSAIAGDTVTINGLTYTGVAGAKADNTEFSIDTSDTAAATDLADSINNDVRQGTYNVSLVATSNAGYVTVQASGTDASKVLASSTGGTISVGSGVFNVLSMTSNVADNNQTLKRVIHQNAPHSVQSTGADKIRSGETSPRLKQVTTTAEFNTLAVRKRWIRGNVEGYIKTFTASTSLVLAYRDLNNVEKTETLTMAQVLASPNLFFLNENE